MPRRELLTSTERLQLVAFPDDRAELIRLSTLSADDLAFARQHRGDHNRLGIAVLLVYLRFPGRVLAKEEVPFAPVLELIAEQLNVPASVWDQYASRDETRRSHLLEVLRLLGMEQFGSNHYRSLSVWLEPTALQTSRGMVLAKAVADEIRRRLIVLPPIPVIDRLCAEAATRAQRKSFVLLTKDLSMEQRAALDGLLELLNGLLSPHSSAVPSTPGLSNSSSTKCCVSRPQSSKEP
jgi:hypothetical protein